MQQQIMEPNVAYFHSGHTPLHGFERIKALPKDLTQLRLPFCLWVMYSLLALELSRLVPPALWAEVV